ncbi:MAG: tetratricopeptide repeat protein [Verrucomicrobiae bacterium]|nr:tetratricopeptide repeat protein [Verrucomicrobiae bacterium]
MEKPLGNLARCAVPWLIVAVLVWSGVTYGDQIDELIRQLSAPEEHQRAEAADALTRIGGPRVQQQFRKMLDSPNPEHRQIAVVGLLEVSDADEDIARVRAKLRDEQSNVRWSAVVALSRLARTEVLEWLQDVAQKDDSEMVREAATELVQDLQHAILWATSLTAAQRTARQLGKPLLVYVRVLPSEPCRQFEEGVLRHREVVDAAQGFVPVRLDGVRDADDVRALDVRGAPTLVLLDASRQELDRISGLVDPATVAARLREAQRGRMTFREARRAASQNPQDVQANWQVAQAYLEQGREDLAIPHLRNVVKHDESNQWGNTDNAMFLLGFALGRQGDYARAARYLSETLERWPRLKDRDKAMYCLGLCRLALGQKQEAQMVLEQLVTEFPDSSVTPPARQALQRLKGAQP